jgi:chromosome segregation ATPase
MIAWLLSPLGRKVGMAVVAVVALVAAVSVIYNRGKQAGYADGQRNQLELDRKSFEQDRQKFLAQLDTYKKADDEAKQKIQDKDSELASLKTRGILARQRVASLPDDQLINDIRGQLQLPNNGAVLGNTDLRSIDAELAQVPILQRQVQALEEKSAAQDQRIDAISRQRDAAVEYGNKVTTYYVKAYSAAQQHHNWFVNLLHGRLHDKKIDLPAPVDLQK